jgi:ABC-type Mn2+/Zn2+ transport system permease subunit
MRIRSMRFLKRLLRNTPFMIAAILCAFMIAVLAGLRLKDAPVFKPLFRPTCIALREEEVIPTLVVFLLASGGMFAGLANLIVQNERVRRLTVGLLVASLAFSVGVLASSAI